MKSKSIKQKKILNFKLHWNPSASKLSDHSIFHFWIPNVHIPLHPRSHTCACMHTYLRGCMHACMGTCVNHSMHGCVHGWLHVWLCMHTGSELIFLANVALKNWDKFWFWPCVSTEHATMHAAIHTSSMHKVIHPYAHPCMHTSEYMAGWMQVYVNIPIILWNA